MGEAIWFNLYLPKEEGTGMAQVNTLIINDENFSYEIISDYNYVHESLLEDSPMFNMIPENKEISMDMRVYMS